jgi:peroxiredoxin
MSAAQRRWALATGIATSLLFTLALAARLRPEIDLVRVGERAPSFRAFDPATARPVSLDQYRGEVVLLNIWATWCDPCRVEMPSIERLHRQFAGTGFRVVAVSIDRDDPAVVMDFVRAMGLTFDILQDREGAVERVYRTTGVPESFVIDREGVIVKKVIGPAQWDAPVNQALIQRLLDVR